VWIKTTKTYVVVNWTGELRILTFLTILDQLDRGFSGSNYPRVIAARAPIRGETDKTIPNQLSWKLGQLWGKTEENTPIPAETWNRVNLKNLRAFGLWNIITINVGHYCYGINSRNTTSWYTEPGKLTWKTLQITLSKIDVSIVNLYGLVLTFSGKKYIS
jgi:hypothetical protein